MKYLLILLFLFVGCEEKETFSEYTFSSELRLNRLDTLKIPKDLRDKLDEAYFTLSERPVERTATQKKVALSNITREYMPIDVMLIGTEKVLRKPHYLFKLDGGGEINFANYTKKTGGEFLFGVRLNKEYNESNTKVFFLNNLKSQGCYQFKDISQKFFNEIAKKGLLTTTKDFIHLKLLVGAIVLISNIGDKYYIGQIHLTDSRLEKLLCR